jgi:molybdate transport system substrate-binding protein
LFAVALVVISACSSHPSHRTVRIAAASDLSHAFEELGKAFEQKTQIRPDFQFGSSGLLAKQIANGAPFYLFAAANKNYADDVVQSGRCDAASMRQYAQGRIVVWSPAGVVAPTQLSDLADPRFERIAIANPEHAPYGRAAKQALEKAGIWDKVEGKIVLGESVQAAMQYAQSQSVQASIVALSLAAVTDGGTTLKVDAQLYDPLEQELVVCGNGEEADSARRFVDFIMSPDGREVMSRYGFLLPNEAVHAKP